MAGSSEPHVIVERVEGVAKVRLRDPDPERFVAESHPMHREFRDVFGDLAADRDVAAMVLLGGEREFLPAPPLASLDALLLARPGIEVDLQREAREIVRAIVDFPKPLVAGVADDAQGMGAQVAFLCDFVVAQRDVVFRDSHTRVGLTSGDGATMIWPLVMGMARARRHILRGHPLSAVDALDLDVVSTLVDRREEIEGEATALARKLIALPSQAFETTKYALNQWLRLGATVSLDVAAALEVSSYQSPDFLALRERAREED
jgi:enoyl-CoA hydratase